MSNITINIDGIICKAQENETILQVARRNNIFIPAICYLTNCSATLACRLCMVEVDGKIVFSCNSRVKEGMSVITKNEQIINERKAIMQVYDINHPLECGVCDQSGECELQNYTLELGIDTQNFSIRDTHKPSQDWGLIHYDPSLCIVCERCVSVCKDVIGDACLKTIPRGADSIDASFKESMSKDSYAVWNKMQKSLIGRVENVSCQECGECTAVCPVGALVSSDFQYKSNSWELTKIPAANPHSSDCSLMYYDVKQKSIYDNSTKIYRVSSDFNFSPLHAAARFGYDFENEVKNKNKEAFSYLIELFNENKIKNIIFNSFITNEEALILQKLKEKYNLNLINHDSFLYQRFLKEFALTSGENLYNANLKTIQNSNFLISVGSFLKTDHPNTSFMLNNALKISKGGAIYFHTFLDKTIQSFSKNMLSFSHKIAQEEAVLFLILDKFANKDKLPKNLSQYLESFYTKKTKIIDEIIKQEVTQKIIDKKTNEEKEVTKMISKKVQKEVEVFQNSLFDILGIEDFSENLEKLLAKKDSFSLIVGEDLYAHKNYKNLANLLGLIQKYTDFKVLIIPSQTNTLGVSLICDLDESLKDGFSLGYNEEADFTLSALGDGNLDMPSLNQQEGTFVSINKRVVPTNAALDYHGYCLNDIANELDIKNKYTINYTKSLPIKSGFKQKEFDDLPNFYDNGGGEHRGYLIDIIKQESKVCFTKLSEISIDVKEDEIMIYKANPIAQFSPFTNKTKQLKTKTFLYVSKEIYDKFKLFDFDLVEIMKDDYNIILPIKIDDSIQGDIAYLPTFDKTIKIDNIFKDKYRYTNVRIKGIKNDS